jgi:hypothetical protein
VSQARYTSPIPPTNRRDDFIGPEALANGWLFHRERDGDNGLRLDRLARKCGGAIAPLTDRRECRLNEPLVTLDNLEIPGNSTCADRGIDEHVAFNVRPQRIDGIDRCYALHKDCGLQSRWADRRWDFRLNNSGRFRTACRQPVAHRTDRWSDAVKN